LVGRWDTWKLKCPKRTCHFHDVWHSKFSVAVKSHK
jgi:hypothetical protein